MSGLTALSWEQAQQNSVNDYDANAALPAFTGPGGALGAVFNSVCLLGLQLQAQILYVQAITRLASSASQVPGTTSPDVDTFVAPFGYTRDPAEAATGTCTLGTPSPASQNINVAAAFIVNGVPVGGTFVQTSTGVQYVVVPDATQSAWNASLNAYVLQAGQSSVNVTVQAVIPGSAGNAQAQTITVLISTPSSPAPAGITTCTNGSAFTNGSDIETDAALITRFQLGMQSKWATATAVLADIASAQTGLTYELGDMLDASGNNVPNSFTVVVNQAGQSSGPSGAVLNAVVAAVEASRPVGVPYTVVGPTLVTINGNVTVTLQPGANAGAVTAAVQAAFAAFINAIGLGNQVVTPSNVGSATTSCSFAKLEATLLGVTGVSNVSGFTINGGTSDLVAPYGSQLVAGSLTVTTQ